jgi:hypothetical protein
MRWDRYRSLYTRWVAHPRIVHPYRERCSGIQQKTFAFPPESLFAFNPESCSQSARNAVRDHPGIPFAFARNPHFLQQAPRKSAQNLIHPQLADRINQAIAAC